MGLKNFIRKIKRHPDFREAFVHHHYLPPSAASYGPKWPLPGELQAILHRQGIEKLYSHQVEALEHLQNGRHVMVATPTASGKSLIFNLAVLQEFLRRPESRALYLFPLKALEQDQLKNLRHWLQGVENVPLTAAIYDGDTSPYRRKQIRSRPPNILFTNPDMLHRGILAYHQSWEKLLRRLSFVILDEVHTYRGIFGSHVTQLLRRLRRISRHYGASPRFILLSATVSNPEQFAGSLVEDEVEIVRSQGTPKAGQHFVFINPETGPNFSAARLFVECIREGYRTIAFTQSRKVTELMHIWISQLSPNLQKKISSYRAGFLPAERRTIEKRLAGGDLLGVISTSALEMGIDIGYLDICLLVGYPGTIINTWQRGGRVGRSGRESLVILLAKPDALDQYFMRHPQQFFEGSFEAAVVDPDNTYVVEAHLPCAAAEQPIALEDKAFWPVELEERLRKLELAGALQRTAEGEPVWYAARRRPHLQVDIRSSGDSYTIFEKETGQAIGSVDGIRAFKECHPGAVYLHRARSFLVDRLILQKKDIVVQRTGRKYFTRVRSDKETEIIKVERSKPEGQFVVRQGQLKVTETVTGYEKRSLPGQELMGVFPLELPSQTFETVGFWVEIENALKNYVEQKGLHFMGGIHAIEHAAIGIFPLFALCDRNDIGGICYPLHPQIGKSAIFIYDGYPGGVGLAQRGFEIVSRLLEKTLRHVKSCECEEGCPSCIHSPKCGAGNKPLDKQAGLTILEGLLGLLPLSRLAANPPPEEPGFAPGPETGSQPEESAPRVLYFDLETQKLAAEVGGWGNVHLMRVSVAVVYDSVRREFFSYRENQIDSLIAHLAEADLIVGFNVKRFDYRVLGAYSAEDLKRLPTFDILEDIYGRLGFRLGLDHLARETLNRGKTADGLQAVEWFRRGEMQKITDYCREDVRATRDLFQHGLHEGCLIYRAKPDDRRVRLLVDWRLEDIVAENDGARVA